MRHLCLLSILLSLKCGIYSLHVVLIIRNIVLILGRLLTAWKIYMALIDVLLTKVLTMFFFQGYLLCLTNSGIKSENLLKAITQEGRHQRFSNNYQVQPLKIFELSDLELKVKFRCQLFWKSTKILHFYIC